MVEQTNSTEINQQRFYDFNRCCSRPGVGNRGHILFYINEQDEPLRMGDHGVDVADDVMGPTVYHLTPEI